MRTAPMFLSCLFFRLVLYFSGVDGAIVPTPLSDFVPEKLPTLKCEAYADAAAARNACKGEFLMWGQYTNNNVTKSMFGSIKGANGESPNSASYGPYYCSGCSANSTTDFGFVGGAENQGLPPTISGYKQVNEFVTSTYCPGGNIETETPDDLTCAKLQSYCEDKKLGWLTYASTFESATGVFRCSGGCDGGEAIFAGQKIALSGNDNDYAAWPFLILWGMIGAFFLLSTVLDYFLFSGKSNQWFTRYFLHVFGYVNLEGEKNTCKSQVFKNPVECLCFCFRRGDNFLALWFHFLSITVLSLGVSILFGDGAKHDHVCFFDAYPNASTSSYSDVLYNTIWNRWYGTKEGPDTADWPVIEFNEEWIISELAIVMFSTSQEMLSYNLVRGGYMGEAASSWLMFLFVCIFALCSWLAYRDSIVFENLYMMWVGLLLLSYVIIPLFAALAYAFASLMARLFRCNIPEAGDVEENKDEDVEEASKRSKKSKASVANSKGKK